MARYQYSVVRCVPEPRTGEFVNVGAIAGSAEDGDWSARQLGNLRRATRMCGSEHLAVVAEFIADVTHRIDDAQAGLDAPLPDDWLDQIRAERRNIVQLSEPMVALGDSAEAVLDLLFSNLFVDQPTVGRNFTTKHNLMTRLRRAYADTLPSGFVHEKVDLYVGSNLHTRIDFGVGTEEALQLTQAWSFQKESVGDVATEVKAWAYALDRLRTGDGARIVNADWGDWSAVVPAGIPVFVSYAAPVTERQTEVFEEAAEVFDALDVQIYPGLDGARKLVDDARALVAA